MSDNPLLVNTDEQNKYKGTLFIEAYDSLIDSITGDAQSELDLAFNAIGAVASTVSLIVDPFGSILGAAFGWLMEHVGILKELLDEVLGDPEDIQANVEATKAKAAELRVLAEDHRSSLATFDGWSGSASEKFQTSMDTMGKELDGLASAVEGKAKVVAMMGTIVSVVRDIIRDAIAQFLGSVVGNGAIGLIGAVFTAGASLAYSAAQIAREAAELAATLAGKVKRVIQALAKMMGKVSDLDDVMAKIGKNWDRFDNAADVAEISYAGYQAAEGVDKAVDKAVQDDIERDKLDEATKASADATTKYQTTKESESKQADDVGRANDALSAAGDKTQSAAADVRRAADEVNRAAASGNQSAYDAAKAKYDAADAKYDAARAEAVTAAQKVARETRELSDAAKASYDALQAGKPADTAAQKAYDDYLKYTGATADPAVTAKNDAARTANEAYEKANVDFMAKNAAAAEANARAFESGSDADVAAAEKAAQEAQSAGKSLESAAAEAKAAGEAARAAAGAASGSGSATPETPDVDDPLEYARKVNESTGYTDALKGAFGGSSSADAADTSSPTVKH